MSPHLLIRTLEANAVFSALSGAVLIALAVVGTDALGVPPSVLGLVGSALLPFAWFVRHTARRPQPILVRLIIGGDVSWVVAAAVILIGFPGTLSPMGSIFLALASLVVADFAVMQLVGSRRGAVTSGAAVSGWPGSFRSAERGPSV